MKRQMTGNPSENWWQRERQGRGWRGRPRAPLVLAAALLTLASWGCRTPVGVWRAGEDRVSRQVSAHALNGKVPSQFSVRVVARHNLLDRFENAPETALRELHAIARDESSRDQLFALAELSYLTARRRGSKQHYLAVVLYAYAYLFSNESAGALEPYDPRFRIACDLYNRSLSMFLRTRGGDIALEGGTYKVPFGEVRIRFNRPGFPWGPELFNTFLPARDFMVRGLRGRYGNSGLGVPLIAIPATEGKQDGLQESSQIARAVPAGPIPATSFLRVAMDEDSFWGGDVSASLELYASLDVVEVEVVGRPVPLEVDLTTPLAYALEESLLWKIGIQRFFGRDTDVRPGISLLRPYSRGKVPVVFVHGTASSPVWWAEMINELYGDRELREKCHFWFFTYATGNPIAYSALLLRESLYDVVRTLDPDGSDLALRQMVVIGHSQGGLLARMQVVDSGDQLWSSISSKRFEELELAEEHEDLLRRALFFERVPFVSEVIFIATPHGGSLVAASYLGRLAASFVELPAHVRDAVQDLVTKDDSIPLEGLPIPTSVANMHPDNPFLKSLANIPIAPEVKSHSIIAVKGDGPAEEGNDGLVEYTSAHLEGVESEYVVRTEHSCQSHPLTIVEVRRILLEHLREMKLSEEGKP